MNENVRTGVGQSSGSDVLMRVARPDLYRANAFRVTQLNVDASPRDISRQSEKLKMMEKFGGAAKLAGGILSLAPLPDGDAVCQAMQRLHDPERRLADELFWFWPHQPGSSAPDEALAAMGRNDEKSAVGIWKKFESLRSDGNVSVHNLAVLSHARALDLEHLSSSRSLTEQEISLRDNSWPEVFNRWKILLEHEGFWSRVTARIRELDDPRLTTGTARRMRASLPLTLLTINAKMAVSAAERGNMAEAERHVKIMRESGLAESAINEALHLAVAPVRERIMLLCKAAQPDADADPANADKVTTRLLDQAKPLLVVLACILPPGSPARDGAYDEVALRALACQIPFGNKTEKWKVSLDLLNLILPLAASESARLRIEDNLRIVQNNHEIGTCWFCRKRPSEDSAAIEVKMHGEVTRTPTHRGSEVKWRTRAVKVPRCAQCKATHKRESIIVNFFKILMFVSIPVLVVFYKILPSSIIKMHIDHIAIILIFLFICTIGSLTILFLLIEKLFGLKGIKSEGQMVDFTIIKELQKQGWSFGEEP